MTERELFEAWIKEVCPQIQWELAEKTDGDYDSAAMSWAWAAWQASANRQGYKLVPVEPTEKMIDAGCDDTPETPSQDYWYGSQPISDDQAVACYKAMIGVIE